MALSKLYTLGKVESLLRILTQTLGLSNIRFGDIRAVVNKNTIDIAELLNGAAAPFYQQTTALNDVASNYLAVPTGTDASYTASTKTIAKTGTGVAATDVGKRLILWDTTSTTIAKITIAHIASYIDANSFTVTNGPVSNITAPDCDYAMFPDLGTSYCDISTLKIDRIIKLVSSNLGEFSPSKDSDFENLANIDEYDGEIFYNHAGEKLHLKKGSAVSTAYGTISLDYYRLPDLATARTDYIDMKDNYIPLLIDRCKLDLYELSDKAAPQNLTDSVTTKVRELMNAGASKDAKIKDKASG